MSRPKGKDHPNWKGGKVEKECLVCGKKFYRNFGLVQKGFDKYCSRKCYGKSILGKMPCNLELLHSERVRKKLSISLKGKHNSPKTEFKKGMVPWIKGKHLSLETKQKLSEKHIGMKKPWVSEYMKKLTGEKSYQWGKPCIKERRKKISEANRGKIAWNKDKHPDYVQGENNPNWQGGVSFLPYGTDWKETLKQAIRERDKYACQLCGKVKEDKSFAIHHIDYDKKNCNPSNLVTLCNHCHIKTNFNRNYWINYFLKDERQNSFLYDCR